MKLEIWKERDSIDFLVRDVRLFLSFIVPSKELFVLPKKVFRVSRVTNENYTLFRNLPKRGQKNPSCQYIRASKQWWNIHVHAQKRSQHQWLLFQKLNMRVLLFFQPLAPTEAMQLCHLNIKVNEWNNRKPSFTQFWPHFINCLFPSIFEDWHT